MLGSCLAALYVRIRHQSETCLSRADWLEPRGSNQSVDAESEVDLNDRDSDDIASILDTEADSVAVRIQRYSGAAMAKICFFH